MGFKLFLVNVLYLAMPMLKDFALFTLLLHHV